MDWYLKKYPDAKILADRLSMLAQTDGEDMSKYLDSENLSLADCIYTERLYRSRDVKRTLRRVAAKEGSRIEKIVYEMLCKRKIVFDDYLLKLSFIKRFGRFKRFFIDGKEPEYRMEMMVHKLLYLGENVVEEVEKEIVRVPGDKAWVYMGFLGSSVGRDVIMEVMSRVSIEFKPFVGSFLQKEDYYNKMCSVILKSPSEERGAVILSMGVLDKAQFYRSLLHVWFSESGGKRRFNDLIEIMREVKVDRRMKTEIIDGYLNGLIYQRRVGEFMKLFKLAKRMKICRDEHKLFEKLYNAVRKYKREGKLDLRRFLDGCKERKKKDLVSPYSWESIHEMYRE
ncbi:uncharacterized protein Eint_030910 [Encephalitozoon intestinalis ATCC 50506]|uniref:Uncharacterized protein n=1 Tax=Encephalitozoon intestinalis (strain ATCC 50506) TaxID=876142 RepID=E0S6A0_ENCIT|nr:uncharacterized protein Eint_030910 [Encephalitozoon intestinalis ATCC 50506]ADM11235.1 hypothetical protein Eint_030910 [Encephalitozoon intestinalis ATCC 50506]UTX44903.1 hypothetical protein GPK93_03g04300 [Encephalitozoon intestinalis]